MIVVLNESIKHSLKETSEMQEDGQYEGTVHYLARLYAWILLWPKSLQMVNLGSENLEVYMQTTTGRICWRRYSRPLVLPGYLYNSEPVDLNSIEKQVIN